ncbi:hypothetical protein [Microbacterium sp. 18062]|uniref:hypothetical protein n=1 Tax=Microbacterium sp. 18062 TaxID=2681410 RepID=UPI00135B5152|nr:hypothetical protein [Microbacterium sp. 18062]
MGEVLHLGALGAAGLGACCVALDGPRPRVRELLLSLVMLAAMLDIVTGASVLPVVGWSALVTVLAMALGARRRRTPEPAALTRMRVSSAIGAVLMAALMLVMPGGHGGGAAASHHGSSATLVIGALVAASGVFAVSSLLAARRAHRLDRVQHLAMSASLLALAAAALVQPH